MERLILIVLGLIVVMALAWILDVYLTARKYRLKRLHVCTVCFSSVYPKLSTYGSFIIEVILWFFFLVPGLIYTLWRITTRHTRCPVCGSHLIIPADSPRGKVLIDHRADLLSAPGSPSPSPPTVSHH